MLVMRKAPDALAIALGDGEIARVHAAAGSTRCAPGSGM
ncbi:MAG: hypothetical protein AVDCRST_MAG26-663 [uncultured Chloroflexia bacterium]|uniref:Uncharacterized protein n=1 Tax=uncultured Chloroflexia bacterium TaxID=1672391 RepID=A0A6J4HI14_9CHLR|nr:MAG: hypothetical protein AVDCRST_MAG26-663 [uncultured Chloroflexia bacterium]